MWTARRRPGKGVTPQRRGDPAPIRLWSWVRDAPPTPRPSLRVTARPSPWLALRSDRRRAENATSAGSVTPMQCVSPVCNTDAVNRTAVAKWVTAYERVWRTEGTDGLAEIFSSDVSYVPSPWAAAVEGLDELGRYWEANRDGHDEDFRLSFDVVAVEAPTAVVRVFVDYFGRDSERWRDLWVLRFTDNGQCDRFEEWPFAPDQPDGHEG